MRPACSRFRIHTTQELPAMVSRTDSEKSLPHDLERAIKIWQNDLWFLRSDVERGRWVACIRQFIFLDTDGDGIADWNALVDGRPSRTLFPLDPDIDGDGIANIFDPDPYRITTQTEVGIPSHLKMSQEQGVRQDGLWREFKVLAVNHSDRHVPEVLDAVSFVLRLKSLRDLRDDVRGFDVLYAFSGRSLDGEIAAYHPSAHAISLPGASAFGNVPLDEKQKCLIRSSILHELGHAFLFKLVLAEDLKKAAADFGGWVFPSATIRDVFDPVVFHAKTVRGSGFVSEYAGENVHEWFAESFAAYIWRKESVPDACHAFKGKKISAGLKRWIENLLRKAVAAKIGGEGGI